MVDLITKKMGSKISSAHKDCVKNNKMKGQFCKYQIALIQTLARDSIIFISESTIQESKNNIQGKHKYIKHIEAI